jgi:hypothetical protein
VLGRILPLTPDSSDEAGVTGEIEAPNLALLKVAEGLFTRLYSVSTTTDTAVAEDQAIPEAEEKVRQTDAQAAQAAQAANIAPQEIFELPPKLSEVFVTPGVANVGDVVPEADPGTSLTPRLDVNGNQIDAVIAKADSGAGLLIVALDTTDSSSLVCSGNRVRSRVADGSTVSLLSLARCTFTGNIVSNEIANSDNDRSLVLQPQLVGKVPAVAVTGNVLIGPVRLPRRPLPSPFHVWARLNTIMEFTTS